MFVLVPTVDNMKFPMDCPIDQKKFPMASYLVPVACVLTPLVASSSHRCPQAKDQATMGIFFNQDNLVLAAPLIALCSGWVSVVRGGDPRLARCMHFISVHLILRVVLTFAPNPSPGFHQVRPAQGWSACPRRHFAANPGAGQVHCE